MAGSATVEINLTTAGLGTAIAFTNSKAMTVPTEVVSGYTVIETATTTAIQLFAMIDHIALAKIYGVCIKAEVGSIYITVDTAGTGTITSATADLVLNVGEACYIPVNPGGNLGMVIDGSAVTASFSWIILGKA